MLDGLPISESGELIDGGLAITWRVDGAYRDLLVDIWADAKDARRDCLWECVD